MRNPIVEQPDVMGAIRPVYLGLLAAQEIVKGDTSRLSLEELEDTIDRLNSAIANPDQFPRVNLSVNSGRVQAALATGNEPGQFGILPILLEQKRAVLARIRELRGKEQIESLQDLIEQVSDPDVKKALKQQLQELERASEELRSQARELALAQAGASEDQERSLRLLKVEVMERRWAVWQKFLARESIATLVGAILLIALTALMGVAMFLKVAPMEVLSNSFLMILGYFFGQATGQRMGTAAEAPADLPVTVNRSSTSPLAAGDDVW
ncbi:hypothetical protein HEK616_26870 [Streptomyces nigrescens]|uniref:Uncharacterized protein n=2 Tax=Streptomyces TaxID=1883 RepID=A0ABM7ZS78_STRNI|nr:hypothetical protein [Streptomyces nigrescens]MEE4418443.1 hypothetical protein [Streptomyces sp. DSM 41528]BDM69200.1 hypothetical protein HEK616_26870 [Streptomyces nigrescens]